MAITATEARRIGLDLDRVVEEERELELSKSLAAELIGAESWAVRRSSSETPSDAVIQDLVGHVLRARGIVEQLAVGPVDRDPSAPEHERREQSMLLALTKSLTRCANRASADADWTNLAKEVKAARRAADVLEAESKVEARKAATDLDERVNRLVSILYFVAGIGLLTLALLTVAFRRLVLRPLRLLQQATIDLGSTSRQEPIPLLSRDEFGQLTHAFNDMTERLRAHHDDLEERVRDRTRELIRTARLADLGTIAAGLAHEINNPLASIAAGVEGLQRELRESDSVSAETLSYIEIVVTEAYRAKDIASRLLRFGRQEQRPHEAVWLAQEAREVASMLAFQAKERGIDFVLGMDAENPPIEGDPAEWRQVFFNVFRNALDAAPHNSTIWVTSEQASDRLILRIRDEGVGFAADQLESVFEPFVSTKDPGIGTGLGLAIVDRIVRENSGRVTAANWDQGGEIQIDLPWPKDLNPANRLPTS